MIVSTPLQQVGRTYVLHEGRKLSYFAGCDYFRLASHPQVLKAAMTGDPQIWTERFRLAPHDRQSPNLRATGA